MKNATMPKSKAKTAYELLSEIRRIIVEEPKRYNQWDTLTQGTDMVLYVSEELRPSCGTVGCVAGWVTALKAPQGYHGPVTTAKRVLGLDSGQLALLVNSEAAGPRGHSAASRRNHAKRGAAHIARFQRTYAKQLKAKRLK